MVVRRVVGVDACKAGWVGVVLDHEVRVHVAAHIADLAKAVGEPIAVVGVDIPIGLADREPRRADVAATIIAGSWRHAWKGSHSKVG